MRSRHPYPYLGGTWHLWAVQGERVMSTVVSDHRSWHDVFTRYGCQFEKINFRVLA